MWSLKLIRRQLLIKMTTSDRAEVLVLGTRLCSLPVSLSNRNIYGTRCADQGFTYCTSALFQTGEFKNGRIQCSLHFKSYFSENGVCSMGPEAIEQSDCTKKNDLLLNYSFSQFSFLHVRICYFSVLCECKSDKSNDVGLFKAQAKTFCSIFSDELSNKLIYYLVSQKIITRRLNGSENNPYLLH